jgi:hypothetical protein
MYRANQVAVIGLLAASALLSGCLTPNYVKVDTADQPKYIDQQVRFRGLYYFRVYDYCVDDSAKPAVVADALYRFRLTGKANALTTSVKFESGTLRDSEIEPFGSTVEYDPDTRRWAYRSHEEVETQRERDEHLDQARALVGLAVELAGTAKKDDPASASDTVNTELTSQLKELVTKSMAGAGRHITAAAPPSMRNPGDEETPGQEQADGGQAPDTKKKAPAKPAPDAGDAGDAADEADKDVTENACRQLARGFQILGPEGWREFDTKERLVLAMSSSAAPLVSTLKELSGRILNASADSPDVEGAFAEEQLRVMNAEAQFTRLKPEDSEEIAKALELARQSLAPEEAKSSSEGAPR